MLLLRVLPFAMALHLEFFGFVQINVYAFQPLILRAQSPARDTKRWMWQSAATSLIQRKSKHLPLTATIQDNPGPVDIYDAKETDDEGSTPIRQSSSALSMTLDELTHELHGKGKAQLTWDCFRIGMDPVHFYNPSFPEQELDNALQDQILFDQNHPSYSCTREKIQQHLPPKRLSQTMGIKALKALSEYCYPSSLGIETSIATLSEITRSQDGTTKLLLKLCHTDHFIESVIIPNPDWGKSTLCISSQVGCAQGCVFCATGKMGRLASLTPDQILVQLYYANKVCRVINSDGNELDNGLPPIDNVVFMGMGDAADNIASVQKSVKVMTDRACFALAASKITISTVGPSPDVFEKLAEADAVLAWSIHAVRDDLRKKLVPTTKYTMEELKDGVVRALVHRSKRLRTLMLEVALMDGLNDGVQEAEEMGDFCLDLMSKVDGMKLMVNLIPFNDIGYEQYRKPSEANVAAFQKTLVGKGVKTYVRTTRGDDESAACGQLATKKRRKEKE
jgi:23S rRNA (adenine2503-C2)-methyltransferase